MLSILQHAANYAQRTANKYHDNTASYSLEWDMVFRAGKYLERAKCNDLTFGRERIYFEGYEMEDAQTLDYLNVGETYQATVCCSDGKAWVGNWGDWLESVENEYCQEHSKTRCSACGEFVDTNKHNGKTECDGHYTDGEKLPEPGEQLTDCREVENTDSHILWLCNRLVETHATKSRYTTLAIRMQYTDYWDKEWCEISGPYHVELIACTPGIIRKKELVSMLESYGLSPEEYKEFSQDAKIILAIESGTHATLWQQTGYDSNELLTLANEQLQQNHMLLGFALDKPQNTIGSTGWDFIRGDILGGLSKCK